MKGGKFITSLVFVTKPYFVVPKNFRLNPTNCLIMKIQKK